MKGRGGRRVVRRMLILALATWAVLAGIVAISSDSGAAMGADAPFARAGGGNGQSSSNWSGYVESGKNLTSVDGSWGQPTATCGTKAGQAAFWVGLDGATAKNGDVEQIGTDADCVKSTGKGKKTLVPTYYAWYELYPAAPVLLPPALYPVSPGDALHASVVNVAGQYTLSITDIGRWTFSIVQSSPGTPLGLSAEWIAEAPLACTGTTCKPVLLSNFGSVTYTGASANGAPIGGAGTANNITRVKGKTVLASASPLNALSTAFTVTWVS